MSFPEINSYIQNQFGSGESAAEVFTANTTNYQPYLTIPAERLVELCQFLRDDEQLFFDLLACITVIDNGADADTMDIFYNLTSIPFEHNLMLKVTVSRRTGESELPAVPSVAHIWRTADWHEREAFDLVGIRFTGHPDLRRILLPKDWVGHPLRADYKEEEQYHGIKTK